MYESPFGRSDDVQIPDEIPDVNAPDENRINYHQKGVFMVADSGAHCLVDAPDFSGGSSEKTFTGADTVAIAEALTNQQEQTH